MKWIRTLDRLPPSGGYYVQMLMKNGSLSKGCESFDNGEWKLGSGHLVVQEVIAWLDEGCQSDTDIALKRLVELKIIKENQGETSYYLHHKDRAWYDAKEAVKQINEIQ